jgi:hypothetical protein
MAGARSPWHALRPVFLAGAATFAWLTFSSSPASADLLPEPTPVVNEILVAAPPADRSNSVEEAVRGTDPAAPVAAGLVETTEPVIEPVLESVEPVQEPVAPILDPVLTPVVQPVTELVSALEPVAGLATAAPVQAVVGLLPDVATEPATTAPVPASPAAGGTPLAGPEPISAVPAQALKAAGPAPFTAPASVTGNWLGASASMEAAEAGPVQWPSPPAPMPSTPGSGGAASGGPSPGSAAWLSPVPFVFSFLGGASAPEFLLHAPEPVSFDPGSSPD